MTLFSVTNARALGKGLQSPVGSIKDSELQKLVFGYKRTVAGRYRAILREDMSRVFSSQTLMVSPKIDGELWFLIMGEGDPFFANPKGRVVSGNIPVLAEAQKLTDRCQGRMVIAGEFFAVKKEGRPRVGDLSAAMGSEEKAQTERLAFSAFDVLSATTEDGLITLASPYEDRFALLERVLKGGKRLTHVPTKVVESADRVEDLYREWVDEGNGEGIVVRPQDGRIFKVKPSISIDAAIIAYTERSDEPEQIRSMLLALMHENGHFQIIGSCGNMPTETRKSLHKTLRELTAESKYRHASSDGALYRFVRPKVVTEVKITDLQGESSSGDPIERMVLSYEGGWSPLGERSGASIIHPVLQRIREDKAVNNTDIRMAQILERCPIKESAGSALATPLEKSTLLRREVYVKTVKGANAVRKLLLWQTNKAEADSRFPAYVVHWTDYSPTRKDPLKREVRLAPTQAAAEALAEDMIKTNIKSGWKNAAETQ